MKQRLTKNLTPTPEEIVIKKLENQTLLPGSTKKTIRLPLVRINLK